MTRGSQIQATLFAGCVLLLVSGCAAYHPRPLDPPHLENQYRARAVNDEGLRKFMEANLGHEIAPWPPAVLDLRTLILIGYYYSPDLEVARAQVAMKEAGIRVAGARVNPTFGFDGGYNRNPESAPVYDIHPFFRIETAGKRGYRILEAQKQAEAARIGLAETGWLVRSRIRGAFYDHLFAARRRELLETEQSIRSEIVAIFDKRLAVGEAARPELDIYRVDLITTQAALRAATGEVAETRAALASSAGIPLSALDHSSIESSTLDTPSGEEALPVGRIQAAGLLHRADIRRMLAEYATADAGLRLELARQYPDITLSPGYEFEEGFGRYVLGGSLQFLPLFHRNQGLIAVAEALRRQVGEQFESRQAQAIGQMERALVQYRAALDEYREASARLVSVQRDREEAARRALAAGQGDRLGLATVRLQTITAARARLDALIRTHTALGALEDAMQQPLETALDVAAPTLISPRKGVQP